jgi:adenylate kinase
VGVIFVAGVHGVGKTTCCHEIANRTELPHCSSSALIKAARTEAISTTAKAITDVPGNQELLVTAVLELLKTHSRVLLDGHFTLLNANGEIESIPENIFGRLRIDGIVLYRDDPIEIQKRLTVRDGGPPHEVALHQFAEENQANRVADLLHVELYILPAFDVQALHEIVSRLWSL